MKFTIFTYLLSFFALFSFSLAAPLEVRNGKPAPPSAAQIAKDFKAPPANTALFFSGFPGKQAAGIKTWANSRKLHVLRDGYPADYMNMGNYETTDALTKAFWNEASEEFAKGVSGVAYLMVAGDDFPCHDRIFWSVEFPAIIKEGKVTEIRMLKADMKTKAPTKEGNYTVWWKKGEAMPKKAGTEACAASDLNQ